MLFLNLRRPDQFLISSYLPVCTPISFTVSVTTLNNARISTVKVGYSLAASKAAFIVLVTGLSPFCLNANLILLS